MTHRLRPLLALLALVAAPALAQQTGTVSGTVIDGANNQPLPGVNVIVQGTTIGSTTDGNGRYAIPNAPVGEQAIRASFIGYQTTELRVTVVAGQTATANFTLQPGVQLDDVVVTALGIERAERSLGYSAQHVSGQELARVPQQNFVSALEGRVAGANFYTSNSMGGSTRIVLRGPRSLGGNNQPLIVIDGIPLDNTTFTTVGQARGVGGYDYGNAAQFVNPDNVESVTVLQGATAAALYGSRAANGVIQITTRGGRRQQGVGIQVSSSVMGSTVFNLPGYQNDWGGGPNVPFQTTNGTYIMTGANDQYFAFFQTDESWGPRLDGRPVRQWYSFDDVDGLRGQATPWQAEPNNVREFFETGVTQNTSIAFSQGGAGYNYRLAYTRFDISDVFPNANLARNQFALNGGVDLSPQLRVNAVANYIASAASGRPGTGYNGQNVFQQFNHFGQRNLDLRRNGPMANIFRQDGSQRGWNWRNRTCANPEAACAAGRLIYFDNPYWVRFQNVQSDDVNRFFGSAQLSYNPLADITIVGEVKTDQYTDRREQRNASFSQALPSYSEDILQVQETSVIGRIQLDRNVTPDVSLTGFVGSEYRYNRFNRNFGQTASGLSAPNLFTLENSVARPAIIDRFEERGVIGLFGEATVGYQDMVYLTGTLRNDWSSTLAEGANSYLYPSVTGSFVFTSLPALQNQDILALGKIRGGVAQTGNDTDPYRTGIVYPVQTPYDGNPVQTLPTALNNANLRPERTTEYTVGTDLQFLRNRLGLDLTLYYEISRDQILPVEVSRASGFATLVLNTGRIDNRGIALALTGTPVLTRAARWDLNFNVGRNTNEIVELNADLDLQNYVIGVAPFGPQIVARVGESYGAMFGRGFVYDAGGNIVLNPASGVPLLSDARVLGNYQPDVTYGIGSTFSFRNLAVSALLSGQFGGDIFSVSNLFGLYAGIVEESSANNIREYGLIPNGVTLPAGTPISEAGNVTGTPFTNRVEAEPFFKGLFGNHEAFIYDATHLRVQEVSVSYTVPRRWFGAAPVQGMTVTAIGRNLGTLYKRTPHFDPAEALSATNLQGIEAGQLPPTRSLGMSLQFTF
jgi:TonB-linked SusC/RagA family outer membrane protein